jgi:putative ABC transport system permease protein
MRNAVQSIDPDMPVSEEGSLPSLMAWTAREEQYRTLLMGVFAGLATVLAAVGIFGVTARGVTHRTRELGIRMAVGATHAGLMAGVLRGSLKTGLLGIAAGLVGAIWASQFLGAFLFGVHAWDPVTYLVVGAFATLLCLAASYLPAVRVTRIDPARVLKAE